MHLFIRVSLSFRESALKKICFFTLCEFRLVQYMNPFILRYAFITTLIAMHNGEIKAESIDDNTIFTVELASNSSSVLTIAH